MTLIITKKYFGSLFTSMALFLISIIIGTILLSPIPSLAAIINVDATVDDDAIDSETGCSLREAIISINAGTDKGGCTASGTYGDNDIINVPADSTAYSLTITGIDDAAAVGDLDVTEDVSIIGASAETTIIDGNNTDRIFDVISVNFTLKNITLQNGNTGSNGGAIQSVGAGSLTLESCVIQNNTATGSGGGIYNPTGGAGTQFTLSGTNNVSNNTADGSGGGIFIANETITIENLTADGNTSMTGEGGGIYNPTGGAGTQFTLSGTNSVSNNTANGNAGGIYNASETTTIENLTADGNTSTLGDGGGIYHPTGGAGTQFTLSGTNSVSNNTANGSGGGIFCASETTTIENLIADGNTSTTGEGGGIYNPNGGLGTQFTLSGINSVSNNTSNGNGGGIYNSAQISELNKTQFIDNISSNGSGGALYNVNGGAGSTLTLSESAIRGNTANLSGGGIMTFNESLSITTSGINSNTSTTSEGGGIWIGASSSASISNTTISSNTAGTNGGGIFNSGAGAPILTHVTINQNSASGNGGGIYTGASAVTLEKSIIANSTSGGNCYDSGSGFTSNGYNIDTDDTCSLSDTTDSTDDPLLATLADNGGSSQTNSFSTDSPALDAIPELDCPPPTTDQRGFPRPADGDDDGVAKCDIGAFELDRCGDGLIQGGEECDDGDSNSDTEADACRTDCTEAGCGDGVIDTGEVCDDGNTDDGDSCNSTCDAANQLADENQDIDFTQLIINRTYDLEPADPRSGGSTLILQAAELPETCTCTWSIDDTLEGQGTFSAEDTCMTQFTPNALGDGRMTVAVDCGAEGSQTYRQDFTVIEAPDGGGCSLTANTGSARVACALMILLIIAALAVRRRI